MQITIYEVFLDVENLRRKLIQIIGPLGVKDTWNLLIPENSRTDAIKLSRQHLVEDPLPMTIRTKS